MNITGVFDISEKLYAVPVHLVIGTFASVQRYAKKKHGVKKLKQFAHGGCCLTIADSCDVGVAVILWLPEYKHTIDNISDLSHECTHAALHVLDMVGVKAGFDNQEPICYLQGHYINESIIKIRAKEREQEKQSKEKAGKS